MLWKPIVSIKTFIGKMHGLIDENIRCTIKCISNVHLLDFIFCILFCYSDIETELT